MFSVLKPAFKDLLEMVPHAILWKKIFVDLIRGPLKPSDVFPFAPSEKILEKISESSLYYNLNLLLQPSF